MATAFLGLGSNLGDRESNIHEAVGRISGQHGIRVVRISSTYETAPVGYTDQPDFLNAVAEIETDLSPEDLLRVILGIEKEMGRVRNIHWGPRVIDIDLLLYDEVTMSTNALTLPHPRMLERAFVIAPLAEIAPGLILSNGCTASEALGKLVEQKVRRLERPPVDR